MVNDLYYRVSVGTGNFVSPKGEVILPDFVIEDSSNNLMSLRLFNFFIWGHSINPKEAKSPLFRCRDLIANLQCIYLGDSTEFIRKEGVLETARFYVDSLFKGEKKELIVIKNYGIDTSMDEDNMKTLLSSIYNIISTEARNHFPIEKDIVVYWDMTENDFNLVNQGKIWDSFNCHFNVIEETNAIILF